MMKNYHYQRELEELHYRRTRRDPPPDPCLPLSYPFLAALLTALPALCAVPTALAARPTPPCAALPTFLTAPLILESADAFFSGEALPTFCLDTLSFALAVAPASLS